MTRLLFSYLSNMNVLNYQNQIKGRLKESLIDISKNTQITKIIKDEVRKECLKSKMNKKIK